MALVHASCIAIAGTGVLLRGVSGSGKSDLAFRLVDGRVLRKTIHTDKKAGGNEGHILKAQLAVDGKTGKYPEFKGNVASVYSKPFNHGGGSSGHYGGNPETYMDVGQAMGAAMAELIKND